MTILLLPLALALPVLNYTAAVPPPDEMLPPSLRGRTCRGGDAFGDGGEDGEGMDDAPPPDGAHPPAWLTEMAERFERAQGGKRSGSAVLAAAAAAPEEVIAAGESPPDVDIDAWNLATEQFVQHSTSAQEYAYTASFGEYNPSGGKDQVAKYMDLSKDELVLARDALRDVLKQIGGL